MKLSNQDENLGLNIPITLLISDPMGNLFFKF